MYIKRSLEDIISNYLFKGKIIIVYGARQVGKTTLVKSILKKYSTEISYFNCEILATKQALEQADPLKLKNFLGNGKIIVLDEAQKVNNIGLSLKLLIDAYPDMQIIATGSSSFDLSNQINEPLTGRALEFILYPFSLSELSQIHGSQEIDAVMERSLIYGMYPDVVLSDIDHARVYLNNLSSQYLYKDVLAFESLKRPDLLVDLLQLLALQLGNEVSMHELAVSLQCSKDTVQRYLDLLEKSFVIFRLRAFSRNLRNEIGKKQKIYFYDLGVRNSLISRLNPLPLRDDVGALWENFCVVERMKYLQANNLFPNKYFWRTHTQEEVDYLEELDGRLDGFEFKWGANKFRSPKNFLTYQNSSVKLVNKDNYREFLMRVV